MRQVAWRAALAAVAATVLSLGSGCVAFNVGEPVVHHRLQTKSEIAQVPSASTVESASGRLVQEGKTVVASLSAQVQEEFPKTAWEEDVSVRVQKRLAFGLFPGAAECYLMPPGALDSTAFFMGGEASTYVGNFTALLFMTCGLFQSISTINSLLIEPFASWSCPTHAFTDWTPGKPKIRILRSFSERERQRMGIVVMSNRDGEAIFRGDEPWPDLNKNGFIIVQDAWDYNLSDYTHLGLIGFHKHLAIFVEPKTGPRRAAGTVTKRRTAAVEGPWAVEIRISGADWVRTGIAGSKEESVSFALPEVEGGGRYEVTATFRAAGWGGDGTTRQVLEKVAGQTVRAWVDLPAKPTFVPMVPYTPPPTQPQVLEVHHYHETRVVEERKPEGAPWDIETVESFLGGRATYLVTIRDASKKAFEVEREVRPDIERNLRESFLAAMPGMDEGRVRAYAVAEYEGRAIRFRGVAFSVQPLTDGWTYDEETRRGTVRLRISEGMTPDEAKRWARENIEAIVREKNVALEAGAALPSGAVYRSLGETLEGGVLTVEFEAVE